MLFEFIYKWYLCAFCIFHILLRATQPNRYQFRKYTWMSTGGSALPKPSCKWRTTNGQMPWMTSPGEIRLSAGHTFATTALRAASPLLTELEVAGSTEDCYNRTREEGSPRRRFALKEDSVQKVKNCKGWTLENFNLEYIFRTWTFVNFKVWRFEMLKTAFLNFWRLRWWYFDILMFDN